MDRLGKCLPVLERESNVLAAVNTTTREREREMVSWSTLKSNLVLQKSLSRVRRGVAANAQLPKDFYPSSTENDYGSARERQ